MYKALIVLALVAVVAGKDCSKTFKEDDAHSKASDKCVNTLKLTPKDLPQSEEDFTKKFDDKCYGKCFMTEMKFYVDNKFDHDAIKKDIVDHVIDADVQKKVLAYTTTCLEEVEKASGGKMTKENECPLAAQFLYCTMQQEGKMDLKCDPPAEDQKSQ